MPTGWALDGTLGLAFTALTGAVGVGYVVAARVGRRRDRRARRWPALRTAAFLGGLAVLLLAIDSAAIGGRADRSLGAHMVEHVLIWLAAAPLLVAGAPLRLALFALRPPGRRRLARVLHSGLVGWATGAVGSTALFGAVVLGTAAPVVFDLALRDDAVHVAEHALYLVSACLVWAPLIGADPLPHRPGPAARAACVAGCMAPMALVAGWLLLSPAALYAPYRAIEGSAAALHDQRVAGVIMLLAGVPALALALGAGLVAWSEGRPGAVGHAA